MDRVDDLRMELNMYKFKDLKVEVEMMNKNSAKFIAKVGDFCFKEADDKVTFLRCEMTKALPNDTEEKKFDTFTTYIKKIKKVAWINEEEWKDKKVSSGD